MELSSFMNDLGRAKTIDQTRQILLSLSGNYNLSQALKLCLSCHRGDKRKSGEPYATHPLAVACLVAFLGGSEALVQSALLHDVVEDTSTTLNDIESYFGKEVRDTVDGVTKIKEIRKEQLIPSYSDEKLFRSACSFHKMLLRSIDNVGVLVIKLCDRVHNMMTIRALEPRKRLRISEETLLVYAPIAHRLGMGSVRNFLENEAFRYMHPDEFKRIESYFRDHANRIHKIYDRFMTRLNTLLIENGFSCEPFQIKPSIKHYHSIYKKTRRQGNEIGDILDLFRVRILVEKDLSCYKALGVIHLNFRPYLDRFKDHISFSKDNGYQTLHAMVKFEGIDFEIQIRTFDMNKTAEFGITASWKYRSAGLLPKLDWLEKTEKAPRQLERFYQETKSDLGAKDIVVSTPDGKPVTLPVGSLALDFAFRIHTDLGHFANKAIINGRPTSILRALKNGDMVRIEVDRSTDPNYLGLEKVRTSLARRMLVQNRRKRKSRIYNLLIMRVLFGFFGVTPDCLSEHFTKGQLRFDPFRIANEPELQTDLLKKCRKLLKKTGELSETERKRRYKEQEIDQVFVRFYKKVHSLEFPSCCQAERGHEILGVQVGKHSLELHDLFCESIYKKLDTHGAMAFARWSETSQRNFELKLFYQRKETQNLGDLLRDLSKYDIHVCSLQFTESGPKGGVCDLRLETDPVVADQLPEIIGRFGKILKIKEINKNECSPYTELV